MYRIIIILGTLVLALAGCNIGDVESPVEPVIESSIEPSPEIEPSGIPTYSLTVINKTDSAFSFYFDSEYKFDIEPMEQKTLSGIASKQYLLEAKVNGEILAKRRTRFDSDVEWIVY